MNAATIAPEVREAAVDSIAALDRRLVNCARDLAGGDPTVHRPAVLAAADRLLDKRLPLMRARDAYDEHAQPD